MITVSKKDFIKRLDLLPESVHEIAFSLETGFLLTAIGKAHHLDDDKTDTIMRLTAAVLFGFLHKTDLATEIQEETGLDVKVAQSVVNEIEQKIFTRVEADLNKVYEPVSSQSREATEEPEEEKTFSFEKLTKTPAEEVLPFKVTAGSFKTAESQKTPEGKPLVLHEEKSIAGETTKPPTQKGFSLPFNLFGSRKTKEERPTVKATVEVPEESMLVNKQEKKIVHYSEFRTPLTPIGGEEEIINLETLAGIKPNEPQKPPKTDKPTTTFKDSPQPKIEGNTVDLRNT